MSDKDDVMPIEVPSDEDLFNSEEVTEEAEAPEAKAEEVEEAEVTEEAKPEEQKVNEERVDHRVPLNELLNEREKRQKLEAQMEAMQAHWEAQQQQQQGDQQWPDIFENPEYYQQYMAGLAQQQQQYAQQVQQQVNQQLAMARMEFLGEISLRNAKTRDPETYQAAWNELTQRVEAGDPTWRTQVLQSDDPGETLLNLYKSSNVTKEVGTDPEAYFQKRIEELKNDPQALAQLLGTPKGPNIDLPPSLTKAGGGGQAVPSISGRDLWDDINS